jgi:hypothetical protein
MCRIIYLRSNRWKEELIKCVIFFSIAMSPFLSRAGDSIPEMQKKEPIRSRFSVLFEMRSGFQFQKTALQKLEIYGKPEWELRLSPDLIVKTIGRIYFDAADKLEPGKPQQPEVSPLTRRAFIGDLLELEVRECYVDWKIKNHYLTIGKQQIVWGKADGLKVLDVVNPTNFREFLLDDFDNSRIPLWSVKTDLQLSKLKLQLVWIPDQSYHDIPDPGAVFFPAALFPAPPQGIIVINKPLNKPNRFFKDADAGFRLSAFVNGWDITLNYLYMYDDFPVAKTSFSNLPDPRLVIEPVYKRLHMAGGTLANSFGKISIRSELGFFIDKYFSTPDVSKPDGLFKSTQAMGVVGVDYSGISNSLVSVQLIEDFIFKNLKLPGRRQSQTFISLLANRSFKNETIVAALIGVQNIFSGSGFIRPSIEYTLKSNLLVKAGCDIFYGSSLDFLGQFNNKIRATLGIQWGL